MTVGNTLPSRWHVRPGSAEFLCMSIHFVCIKKMTTPYCSSHRWVVFVAVLPSSGLFLSATPRCWSTFIFRTTGLRAVEDFVRGVLLTLVGHTLTSSVSWAWLPFPHCGYIIAQERAGVNMQVAQKLKAGLVQFDECFNTLV